MPPAAAGVPTGRAPSGRHLHHRPRSSRPLLGLAALLALATLVQLAATPAAAQSGASTLTLVEVVTNDNGGTAAPSAWTLKAAGPTRLSVPSGTRKVVRAGSYDLSETGGPSGYTASPWTCSEGQVDGDTVTVAPGRDVTCTITNDDQQGRIVVTMITDPPGTATFSFTATGTGYTSFSLTGGGSNTQALDAGTYTVTNALDSGWLLTGLGGSRDPRTPYTCTVTGGGASTGQGDLSSRVAIVTLRPGDTVACVFESTRQSPGGASRTPGFWSTHPVVAEVAWSGGIYAGRTFGGVDTTPGIADRTLCGRSIDTLRLLEGGFWADVARTSARTRRTDLDQARMLLLPEVLAAELNAAAFGAVPTGGPGVFAEWEKALCGTDVTAISAARVRAASFNRVGDSAAFTPGTSADARLARRLASVPFWDTVTEADQGERA